MREFQEEGEGYEGISSTVFTKSSSVSGIVLLPSPDMNKSLFSVSATCARENSSRERSDLEHNCRANTARAMKTMIEIIRISVFFIGGMGRCKKMV